MDPNPNEIYTRNTESKQDQEMKKIIELRAKYKEVKDIRHGMWVTHEKKKKIIFKKAIFFLKIINGYTTIFFSICFFVKK